MRFPDPVSIHAADIYRDGGSYVVVYRDDAGRQYELEIPVLLDDDFARVGYASPCLNEFVSDSVTQLTWAEGASLGALLAPLVTDSIEWGGPRRARQAVELLLLQGRFGPSHQ